MANSHTDDLDELLDSFFIDSLRILGFLCGLHDTRPIVEPIEFTKSFFFTTTTRIRFTRGLTLVWSFFLLLDSRNRVQLLNSWEMPSSVLFLNSPTGCLHAANAQKASGQNDNDVMNVANEIYRNDHGAKFTLEHCWRELRNDQKWCLASSQTDHVKSKRRKLDDGSQISQQSSSCNIDESQPRPLGVKAAKGKEKGVPKAWNKETSISHNF